MALKWRYEKYRKLYVREVGKFAGLPLMARAVAAYLLKCCDDDGCIELVGRDPADAIAFQNGGADRSDRRMLRKIIPQLLAEGHLVREGDRIRIRNFIPAQNGYDVDVSVPLPGIDDATTEPRSDHDGATNGSRPGNDAATTVPRTGHDRATKGESSAENLDPSSSRARSPTNQPPHMGRAREEGLGSIQSARDELWSELCGEHAKLKRELGLSAPGLPLAGEGPKELQARLRELVDAEGLDAAKGRCRHVMAVRAAEARERKTLQWFGASIWSAKSFYVAVGKEAPKGSAQAALPDAGAARAEGAVAPTPIPRHLWEEVVGE